MTSLARREHILAAWAALFILFTAPAAGAHGGFPRPYNIFFEPGAADHVMIRSDVWGVFRTTNGGESWDYICNNAWGGRFIENQRRSMVLLEGGRMLVASLFAGLQIADDLCSFSSHPQWEPESEGDPRPLVQDVRLGADGTTLYVLTVMWDDGGFDGRLWQSVDRGDTWEQVGERLPREFSGTQLAFAPSDPARIYVSGKLLDESEDGVVLRSADGGLTWESAPVPAGISDSWTPRLFAVDPSDADSVYFWMDRDEDAPGQIRPDELWHSSDGGASWQRVFEATGDLPGFTFSPDGSVVLIAGEHDGIWRATPEGIAEQGQSAFSKVFEGRVFSLKWTEDGLYAGNDDFAPRGTERFMLGVSDDEGESFERIMDVCEPRLIQCPEDSPTARLCERAYSGEGGFVDDYLEGPRCVPSETGQPDAPDGGAADEESDAGTDPEGSGAGTSCSCEVPAKRSRAGGTLAWLLLAAGALVGRRRSGAGAPRVSG